MTIGEVSMRSGLPSSTLRFYEKEKLIPPPRRVGGRRDYDEEVFASLQLIQMSLECGFGLSEARTLLQGFTGASSPPERWRVLTAQKLKDVRVRMTKLRRAEKLLERAARCKCISLADCADLLLQGKDPAWSLIGTPSCIKESRDSLKEAHRAGRRQTRSG